MQNQHKIRKRNIMKHQYKKGSMIITLLLFITIIVFFYISFNEVRETYNNNTKEVVISLKKTFLKDTVNNVIEEIEEKRATRASMYKRVVEERAASLQANWNGDESVQKFIETFEGDRNPLLWTALLIDKENQTVLYSSNNIFDEVAITSIEQLKPRLSSFEEISFGQHAAIYGISTNYVEGKVKEEISGKIRNLKFENNSYIWVNEIINDNGGDNYAIRRVHPFLKDTEGEFLSTKTMDSQGNFPYKEALEGVKEHGEVYFSYYFQKPGSDEIVEKIAYAKLYKDYNWVIAMGVYTDDMQGYIDYINNESDAVLSDLSLKLIAVLAAILIAGNTVVYRLERKHYLVSKKEIEDSLNMDELTLALNRRAGTSLLEQMFSNFQSDNFDAAIMIFDVDNFKSINDEYGHLLGDAALSKSVEIVRKTIRTSDKLIRWGGDEFVIIFYGLNEKHIQKVGEKILKDMASLEIKDETHTFSISPTISIGFSVFKQTDTSYTDALGRADEALYLSKEHGRNTFNIKI